VKDHYYPKNVYFEFTGGEVTLYRHFADICKFCTEIGVKVGFITNGSRTLRWWEENKQYFDHVCISYHSEFASSEHFIDVLKILHNDVRTHVNIMMNPSTFDKCYELANEVITIPNLSLALQPLIHELKSELYTYTEDQQDVLNNQHDLFVANIRRDKDFKFYRGAMRTIDADGVEEFVAAHNFIADNSNNWQGWKCYAGKEQMIVDMDGRIYRGWCKMGGSIGNINDENISFVDEPIVCTKTSCHCNFDIMSTKEQV
jgi:MoaA/NifB/PqqE/SkfB family radical SAM enzyme